MRRCGSALETLWHNLQQRRVYVTGGARGALGRSSPSARTTSCRNEVAYAETCAGVAHVQWAWRMLLATGEARFRDADRDGAVQRRPARRLPRRRRLLLPEPLADRGRHRRTGGSAAPAARPTWRGRSAACRAPVRHRRRRAWIHQYAASRVRVQLGDGTLTVRQETGYPWTGGVAVIVEEAPASAVSLRLAVPAWAEGATLQVSGDGQPVDVEPGAYAEVRRRFRPGDTLQLSLPLEPRLVQAHRRVAADVGRRALLRGPLVYCLETADQGGEDAWDLRVDPSAAVGGGRAPRSPGRLRHARRRTARSCATRTTRTSSTAAPTACASGSSPRGSRPSPTTCGPTASPARCRCGCPCREVAMSGEGLRRARRPRRVPRADTGDGRTVRPSGPRHRLVAPPVGSEEAAARRLAVPDPGDRVPALRLRPAHRLQRHAELRADLARDDRELHRAVGRARQLPLRPARPHEPGGDRPHARVHRRLAGRPVHHRLRARVAVQPPVPGQDARALADHRPLAAAADRDRRHLQVPVPGRGRSRQPGAHGPRPDRPPDPVAERPAPGPVDDPGRQHLARGPVLHPPALQRAPGRAGGGQGSGHHRRRGPVATAPPRHRADHPAGHRGHVAPRVRVHRQGVRPRDRPDRRRPGQLHPADHDVVVQPVVPGRSRSARARRSTTCCSCSR